MEFKLSTKHCLIILFASACGVLSYVIPEKTGNIDATDPIVSGCNTTRSCFLVPDSCLTTGSCKAGVAVAATGDRFQFEMMAVDSVYVAAGLSDDAFMGKDSVVECVHDPNAAEKGVQIFVSFNVGTTNTRLNTSAAENGVNLVTGSFIDGVVRCTFTRENTTRAEGITFDLVKRQYHLLVASGSKLHPNRIAFHNREASGSHNGRLLADVGMFVNPNFARSDWSEEYDYGIEYDEVADLAMDGGDNRTNRYVAVVMDEVSSTEEPEYYSDCEEYNVDYSLNDGFDDHVDGSGDAESDPGKGFTARGCNVTKSCFLLPPSCIDTDDCKLAASVRQTNAGFEFEMHAVDSTYVAVGLSMDAFMGSDSVVECVANGGNILGFTSWNKGHKNHRSHDPLSKSGIALIEGSTSDGKVYCKFARDPITAVEGVVFDLTKSQFHLLIASGSRLKDHGIGFHDRGYAGSYAGRLLGEVGMFSQRRSRDMTDESEEGDIESYEVVEAFRPIVTIV